jgi:hypothetical protein
MGPQRDSIREEAYEALVMTLKILKPDVIVSCQCKLNNARNPIAQDLCSLYRDARAGKVKVVQVGNQGIQVIQGFHPIYFLYKVNDKRREREAILKGLFQKVFSRCAL